LVKALEGAIAKTEAKLAALESTSVADAARQLEDASEKLKGAQEQIDDIETQIDAASRKLSLWFGRKKRLETSEQDVFKPANDLERVGAASTAVKKKIAECTEASYMLQAKQDEYELYPSNERLRDEVKQLELSRERLLEELRREVDKAVDVVLADANRQLEDLKIRRDVMSGQLETTQERVDFLKVLSSSDPLQRESLKQRLSRDLAESRASLKEVTP
jgi:cellulose biosynthesis protein BcsQ